MDNIELAKKALKTIQPMSFPTTVYAGDWCSESEINLSSEEILYLIHEEVGHNEIFDGFKLKKVDLNELTTSNAKDEAWPDGGGPEYRVNSSIPRELIDISNAIRKLDVNDEKAVMQVRDQLMNIEDGDYTFPFTVVDKSGSYYFDENAEEKIYLTAEEARGLLINENDNPIIFDGIRSEYIDEDDINLKADEKGTVDDYDNLEYREDDEVVVCYLNAWYTLIDKIINGEVTEDKLDIWLHYFDDVDNYDMDIDEWVKDNSDII